MFSKNLPQDILINIIVLILLSISNSNGSTIVASHESGIQNTASFSIYTVTNTNDSGVGSLRQAITDANNNPGPDTITFNIPSSDPGYANNVWSIQPASLLSSLTGGETTIDATTQTNNQGNTNALGPEVQLDGVNLSSTDWLLSVESNKNVVKGFTIIRGGGAGIQIISTASQNIISDNYIGSDAYGLASFGNGYGVKILGGAWGNQISDCLISGNILDGITIEGIGTDSNILENNLIGLSSFGIAALGNGRHGVSIIDGPKFNLIGGDLPEYNTISGNTLHGVYVTDSDTNIIWNNYIGLDWAGNADLGNGGHGVAVVGGASSNGVQQNIISGNNHHGVYLEGSGTTDNYVRLNFIGSDSQGAAPIPNGWHGVAVYNDAQSNRIGTVSPPWGNVIVSSSWSGVAIINSNQNTVSYNTIGTDENGTATSLGNGYYGVIVEGMNNAIGPDNAIAYNGVDGVRIDGSSYTSQNNTITQNSIYSNTGKGIELWTTGNTELSAPTISQTTCQQVDGTACAGCTVEIFSDSSDEGHAYEGETTAHATTGVFSWSGALNGPNVTATATDSQGNTSEFSATNNVGNCNTTPTASFSVDPLNGFTTTAFSFSAAGCSDLEDLDSVLEVRWDWEADGIYDTVWTTTKTAVHTYPTHGTYTTRLQVRDTGWREDSTTKQIEVKTQVFLPLVIK